MISKTSVLTDYAYTEILQMILSGEIKHGSRIREDMLAQKLDISRTPIREAVNRLIQNGFIKTIQRKGLYCVNFTQKELLDIIDMWITLESLSFEKCIDRAVESDIEELRQTIDEFAKKFDELGRGQKEPDSKALTLLHNEYDLRFHVHIAQVSTSTRLVQYVTDIENLLLAARHRRHQNNRSENIRRSWEQHTLMVEAIQARDKARTRILLEEHLALIQEMLITDPADQ